MAAAVAEQWRPDRNYYRFRVSDTQHTDCHRIQPLTEGRIYKSWVITREGPTSTRGGYGLDPKYRKDKKDGVLSKPWLYSLTKVLSCKVKPATSLG
jgi:hypothetical protein